MIYPTKKVSECIERLPKKSGIPRNRYANSGAFPIIDQGLDFIGGYTDDKSKAYQDGLPIIIFGDHTRALKFVEVPFAVGADGTQVLKPKDFLDPRYFYLALLSIDIKSRGYARHFSILKEMEIPLPPIVEQRKIVARLEKVLGKVKEAKRLRAEAEALSASLLPAELHKIFSSCQSNLVPVGDLCDIKGGKRVPKGHVLKNEPTTHPYIRVADFMPYGVDQSNLKYVDDKTFKFISRYTIGKNDVFISIAGTIGSTGIIPENLDGANLTENAAKLTNLKGVDQRYLMYMLTTKQVKDQIFAEAIHTTISKLGLFRIARLKIPLPSLAEQKRIVARLDTLLAKVRDLRTAQSQTAQDLISLERSVLHKAFTS
ncbi:MAG TPA: restriction endonuclease subunit S [Candidatus Paceibacterota bacterium]